MKSKDLENGFELCQCNNNFLVAHFGVTSGLFLTLTVLTYDYYTVTALYGVGLMVLSNIMLIYYAKDKVIINGRTITRTSLFHKPRIINFDDIQYIRLIKRNGVKALLYLHNKKVIKISSDFKNYHLFEELIKQEQWEVQIGGTK